VHRLRIVQRPASSPRPGGRADCAANMRCVRLLEHQAGAEPRATASGAVQLVRRNRTIRSGHVHHLRRSSVAS
jgi:hypothetical protein